MKNNKYHDAGKAIITAQSEDRNAIPYYARYNLFTGSPNASILMSQIIYWWKKKGKTPFYKFREPCGHKAYKPGDSWIEELGFTEYQFDGALKRIGTKIKTGMDKSEILKSSLVIYWTDRDRMTWYEVNEELFYTLVGIAYMNPTRLANREKPEETKPDFSEYLLTEITTEITNNTNSAFSNKKEKPQAQPFTEGDFPTPKPPQKRTAEERKQAITNATASYYAGALKKPWLKWCREHINSRNGINKEHIQHVGWLFENITGIIPVSDSMWKRWKAVYADMYIESSGNFDLIEVAIHKKWDVDPQYRPEDPYKFVRALNTVMAERRKKGNTGATRIVLK